MDLILRPIERRPQRQFSMARRFKLQLLRRYSVKFSKMRHFTLETLRLDELKSTGGRRTNIPWIYSPWLYHCATSTHVMKAEFSMNINTFCHIWQICVIFGANTVNTKWRKMLYVICCLNLLLTECNDFLVRFTLHQEQAYVLFGPHQSSIMFSFIGF